MLEKKGPGATSAVDPARHLLEIEALKKPTPREAVRHLVGQVAHERVHSMEEESSSSGVSADSHGDGDREPKQDDKQSSPEDDQLQSKNVLANKLAQM